MFTVPFRMPSAKTLTADAVESVLYVMSPAGFVQLTQELHRRGFEFTADELDRCATSVVRARRATAINHEGVTMFALNGLSR